MKKILKLWVGVNDDGFVSLHTEQPIRNEKTKKWVSSSPFCNSIMQRQFEELVKESNMSWKNDVEFFEIPLEIE